MHFMLICLISVTGRHKMNHKVLIFFLFAAFTATLGQDFQANEELIPQDAANNAVPTVINANVVVDDQVVLYADGIKVGFDKRWFRAKQFKMPATTEVVAIKAKNFAGPYGIRASFDGARLFTDTSRWRCSATKENDWTKASFDDSQWPLAKTIKYKGGQIQNMGIVNEKAEWIWTENSEDETVYCRAFLDVPGYIMVDDKMEVFADGKLLGTNSRWDLVKSFDFPGKTRVIAISGQNFGGPYGIRASIGGNKLITSDMGRWRCTNYVGKGVDWTQPTYIDKNWPKATVVKHHLMSASNIDKSAKWIWGQQNTKTYCRAFWSMFATLIVDDHMDVYADGILIGTNRLWSRGMRFRMPGQTQLVAIKAYNTGGPYGIMGFFAAGRLVTGSLWKCFGTNTDSPPFNWNTLAFDDSSWAPATVLAEYKGGKKFSGIKVEGHGSKWIWAAGNRPYAFCRGFIRKASSVATAVTGMADTQPLTSAPASNAAVSVGSDYQENQVDQNTFGSNNGGVNDIEDDAAEVNVHQVLKKKPPIKGQFNY